MAAGKLIDEFTERRWRGDTDVADASGFCEIGRGDDQRWCNRLTPGVTCNGERSVDMPEGPIESEFANEHTIDNSVWRKLAGCHERPERDWQIERSASFSLVRGCEINSETSWR
jgi:hypothetical protein